MADWEERITIDPEVLAGKPIIKGTRLSVEFIIELLSGGVSIEELLENYPRITKEDVLACLAYAADVLQDMRVFPLKAS
jgi:uncharacterized protein (DUF433 family)